MGIAHQALRPPEKWGPASLDGFLAKTRLDLSNPHH